MRPQSRRPSSNLSLIVSDESQKGGLHVGMSNALVGYQIIGLHCLLNSEKLQTGPLSANEPHAIPCIYSMHGVA